MITIIVTVLVLVYKSFCNTVCIYGHANKASCCYLFPCSTAMTSTACHFKLVRGAVPFVKTRQLNELTLFSDCRKEDISHSCRKTLGQHRKYRSQA